MDLRVIPYGHYPNEQWQGIGTMDSLDEGISIAVIEEMILINGWDLAEGSKDSESCCNL